MTSDRKAGIPIGESWRDLARRVQEERNPEKVIELAAQLVARFDEEKRRTRRPLPRRSTAKQTPAR